MREMKLSYFVRGAVARDILLRHVHGIETGTATADVDFGVAVGSWEQFDDIKARLIETERFERAKNMAQRLYYKSGSASKDYPLDIIPFGKIENPPNSIAWPPDGNEVMSVIGYDEALATIVEIEVLKRFRRARNFIAWASVAKDVCLDGARHSKLEGCIRSGNAPMQLP